MMAGTLVFYTNPMSRGQIVRWMLEEIGAPYETRVLDYGGSMKSPDYLAINPMGKVPAITHGEAVVTEAAAICAYLAEAFPDAGLAPPPGSPARAPYYRWLFFAAGCLEPAIADTSAGFVPTAEQTRRFGYGSLDQTLDALESALQGLSGDQHLAGSRFSAADLYVGSQLDFGLQFGGVEKRPVFEAYVGRLRERPAYQRAKAVDHQLIAEMQKS